MGNRRYGFAANRTPNQAKRELALPCFLCLIGVARADFALSTITGPARTVTLRRTARGIRTLSIIGRQDWNTWKKVSINRFQWDEAVRPVLKDERWQPSNPLIRNLIDTGRSDQVVEWIALALEQSFIDAGYGPPAGFPVGQAPFSPSDLGGLDTWLDASDASTIVLNPDVERWGNKANSWHASNHVPAEQPTLSPASLNGLDTIAFDGIDDHFTIPLPAVSDYTLFVVGRFEPSASDRGSWLSAAGFDGSFGGIDARVFQDAASPPGQPYGAMYQKVAGIDRVSTAVLTPSTWALIEYDEVIGHAGPVRVGFNVGFGGSDLEEVYTASTLNDAWDPSRQLFGESPPILASIGRYLGSINGATDGPAYLEGSIAELLLYTRVLSDDERTSVRSYLRAKWAI